MFGSNLLMQTRAIEFIAAWLCLASKGRFASHVASKGPRMKGSDVRVWRSNSQLKASEDVAPQTP